MSTVTLAADQLGWDGSHFYGGSVSGNVLIGPAAALVTGSLTASGAISVGPCSVIGGAASIAHSTAAGYVHLPTGGAANQIIKNSGSSGTGAWGTVTENAGALGSVSRIDTATVGSVLDIQQDATGNTVARVTFFKNAGTGVRPQIVFYGYDNYDGAQKNGTIGIDYYGRLMFGGTNQGVMFGSPLLLSNNGEAIEWPSNGSYTIGTVSHQRGAAGNYDCTISVGNSSGSGYSPNLVIAVNSESGNYTSDYNYANTGNPALIIQSGLRFDATHFIRLEHDQTNGNINVGGGNLKTNAVFMPVQAATTSAPPCVRGGIYFDTTLNKLRIGGMTLGVPTWETVASA